MGKLLKVLIAEDEQALAKALGLKLESAGFTVTVVGNGQDALDKVKTEYFGLLILDLVMPRLDGFAVLQNLKDMGSKVPVIVTSNLGQAEDIERVKKLGAKEFFIKSDTPLAQIVAAVKTYLS